MQLLQRPKCWFVRFANWFAHTPVAPNSDAQFEPVFTPWIHIWEEHFRYEEGLLQPVSPEARGTVRILRLNEPERVAERQQLMLVGLYPPPT